MTYLYSFCYSVQLLRPVMCWWGDTRDWTIIFCPVLYLSFHLLFLYIELLFDLCSLEDPTRSIYNFVWFDLFLHTFMCLVLCDLPEMLVDVRHTRSKRFLSVEYTCIVDLCNCSPGWARSPRALCSCTTCTGCRLTRLPKATSWDVHYIYIVWSIQ